MSTITTNDGTEIYYKRKPCCMRNSIWPSHASELNGHPSEKVTAGPVPQSLWRTTGAATAVPARHRPGTP